MPALTITTRYRSTAMLSTTTPSAIPVGEELDEQIRELCQRWRAHEPVVDNLVERVDALLTWGADWSDYDADPPAAATVEQARDWIKQLYLDVVTNGRTWIDPLVTASEDGEAMFEWQIRGRRLTIDVTEAGVCYSKISGTPPNLQFEDGQVDTRQSRESLWAWLTG